MLALPAGAQARALLVAGNTPELPLVEVSNDRVVSRIPLPAPASAVAVSPFGGRGYAAAGNLVIEVDIDNRAETRRVALPGPAITALAVGRDGRLYALQGDRVTTVEPAGLTVTGQIALGGQGVALALGRQSGGRAAVVRVDGRIAMLALSERRLLRSVRVPGARGVAVDGAGRTWVSARGVLRLIQPGAAKVSESKLDLPAGVGGALALSPRDGRLAVGAVSGRSGGAVVDLQTRTVRRLVTGAGPGTPAWNLDATRLYYADGGGASISIVGAASRRRLDVVGLAGLSPFSVVE